MLVLTGCQGEGLDVPQFNEIYKSYLPVELRQPQAANLAQECGVPPVAGTHGDAGGVADFDQYLKCTAIGSLRSVFFGEGPQSILHALNAVDDAMNAYETHAIGRDASCMEEDMGYFTGAYAYVDAVSGVDGQLDLEVPHYLGCLKIGADWRAWGRTDDETWYVREGGHPYFNTLVTGNRDGGALAGALIFGDVDAPGGLPSGVVKFRTNPADSLIELTYTGFGIGYGCGTHVIMNQNYISMAVRSLRVGNAELNCDADYQSADNGPLTGLYRDQTYCYSATTFQAEQSTVSCVSELLTSSNYSLTTLNHGLINYQSIPGIFQDDPPPVKEFDPKSPTAGLGL